MSDLLDLSKGARLLAEGTPRPWQEIPTGGPRLEIVARKALAQRGAVCKTLKQDAALIVYAVNNLEALLGVAEAAQEVVDDPKTGVSGIMSPLALTPLREALATLHQQTSGATGATEEGQ